MPYIRRFVPSVIFVAVMLLGCGNSSDTVFPKITDTVDWNSYLGDPKAGHYSPLTQINRSNVSALREVWRYESENLTEGEVTQIQTNPLVIDGVLYGVSPTLAVFALDARNGQALWRFETPRAFSLMPNPNRGLAYWSDGHGEARLLVTADHFLYAIDARSGRLVSSFGRRGKVDLREGIGGRLPDDVSVNATSPGAIYQNLLIVGSRVSEFGGAAPGDIRAYDVISGELKWTFRTIPDTGEEGADSWPSKARSRSGGANSWPGITVDIERGIAFVPTGSASFDFYGGDRPGDNLFANSLVALDAATGRRLWHQQLVRHDLWDRDLPAAPNLITLERDDESIDAVAQVTKTGHTFIFNRETGQPLFPMTEVAVGGDALPGEHPSMSQPLPLSPPPFTRQHLSVEDLSKRTPLVAEVVRRKYAQLSYEGLYTLPSRRGTIVYPGIDGGAEWGGAAWDEASQTLYVNANEVPYFIKMVEGRATDEGVATPRAAYLMACSGCHGVDLKGDGLTVPSLLGLRERMGPLSAYRIARDGRGRMPANQLLPWYGLAAVIGYLYLGDLDADQPAINADEGAFAFLNAGWQKLVDPDSLPASAPPWGSLTAIDLRNERIKWRLPLGDYPKAISLGYQGLGAENYGGPVVTAGGLLFIAATPDSKFRAFDSASGELLWETTLPVPGFATPAVYQADGRQYVVIAAGGGKLGQGSGADYIAYALPDKATSQPQQ